MVSSACRKGVAKNIVSGKLERSDHEPVITHHSHRIPRESTERERETRSQNARTRFRTLCFRKAVLVAWAKSLIYCTWFLSVCLLCRRQLICLSCLAVSGSCFMFSRRNTNQKSYRSKHFLRSFSMAGKTSCVFLSVKLEKKKKKKKDN